MPPKLGIIAGGGQLPPLLIDSCLAGGRELFVVALRGQADRRSLFAGVRAGVPHAWVRLGAAGEALKMLQKSAAVELVLAGSVRRPSLKELWPDLWTAKFFARTGAAALGDDGILRALIETLEGEGFAVVGVDQLLPDMLAPEGPFGACRPQPVDATDIKAALAAALRIGGQDIGQGAVARGGVVIAEENADGTDIMLAGISPMPGGGRSGVLVKVSKPGQEKRADLPTIGADTVAAAAAAGLSGIAVQAGAALVIGFNDVAAAADRCGLFVTGIERGDG